MWVKCPCGNGEYGSTFKLQVNVTIPGSCLLGQPKAPGRRRGRGDLIACSIVVVRVYEERGPTYLLSALVIGGIKPEAVAEVRDLWITEEEEEEEEQEEGKRLRLLSQAVSVEGDCQGAGWVCCWNGTLVVPSVTLICMQAQSGPMLIRSDRSPQPAHLEDTGPI